MAEVRKDTGECEDVLTTATEMNSVQYLAIKGEVDGLEFYFPAGSFKIGDEKASLRLTV
jgi:hypothetical protein